MKIKNLIDEDFVNYTKPSMFIATSYCTFKCDKEAGCQVCQNSDLATAPIIDISTEEIVERYLNNPITEAIVIGGLEPFDQFDELVDFIAQFHARSNDDIVIYTGYYPDEIWTQLLMLQDYSNIIIKFGRFIPNDSHKFDNLLKVELASDNQYAERLDNIISRLDKDLEEIINGN